MGYLTIFAFFIMFTNFLLIMRAFITFKADKFVTNEKPLVSILVPAYNESVGICDSINSLLNQDYPNYEIVVVDDGSSDDTYEKVQLCFGQESKVRVFRKENGGKAMALNFAATKASGELFMCIDADTILMPSTITRMVGKKKLDSDAVAAMVGIANEYKIKDGQPQDAFVPKNIIIKTQFLEYMKSYVIYRCSTKDKNVVTVISGACGIISREIFDKCGGYKKGQLGEDMELTMNIHTVGGKVQFLPETLAWTEAPNNIKDLGKQRVRWFRGALQALTEHRHLNFKKGNWFFSFLMLPYTWLSGIFSVWVEVFTWIYCVSVIFGSDNFVDMNSWLWLWMLILLGHHLNTILVITFAKKKLDVKYKKMSRVYFSPFFEGVFFHFFYVYWLVKAHLQQMLGVSKKWNKLKRNGINTSI
jgi:hypothetical protein